MWWVLRREAVDDAVNTLANRRIHEHLPGYLATVWSATREARTDGLRPDFRGFHEYFMRVPGREEFPYLRPFNSAVRRTAAGANSIWFQSNVAGSYAPSSIRAGQPLWRILEVSGRGASATYALRPNHPALALEHLAFGTLIPAAALATYLYREFAFDTPSLALLVSIFRFEFGYETEGGAPIESTGFQTLYADDSGAAESADLFEEFDA